MLRRTLALALFLVAALPVAAGAQEYPPGDEESLTVSDSSVAPGQTITFEGREFAAGSEGTVTFFSAPVVLGTYTADGAGTIRGEVRIPADAEPGRHTLELRGTAPDGSARVLSAALTVAGDDDDGAASGGDEGEPGRLARTGSSIAPWVALGTALLLAGATAVVVGRARRTA